MQGTLPISGLIRSFEGLEPMTFKSISESPVQKSNVQRSRLVVTDPTRKHLKGLWGFAVLPIFPLPISFPPEARATQECTLKFLLFFNPEAETYALVVSELQGPATSLATHIGYFGVRTYRMGCHHKLHTGKLGMGAFVSFSSSCGAPSLVGLANLSPSPTRTRVLPPFV